MEDSEYYFACEFDKKEVSSLIASGQKFYKYLQDDAMLWKVFMNNMNPADPNFEKASYLNRGYAQGKEELHTTMFFGDTAQQREAYANKTVVKENLNHDFELEIHGVVITPSTLGLRIGLPKKSLDLWEFSDDTGKIHDAECKDIDAFGNKVLEGNLDVFNPGKFAKGSRAHATVLTASSSSAVQTGLDLVDVMYCEKECAEDAHYRQVEPQEGWSAKMRYYGFGRYVFYLDEKKTVKSTFRRLTI